LDRQNVIILCCTPHAGSAAFAGVHVLTTMAPKRIAINGSNSKVAKKGKVSDVLTRAIATLPRKELVELFSTHVLPGVIDKAFRGIFQEALNAHSRTDAEKQEIKWDSYKKSIARKAKELKKSLRRLEFWEEQYCMTCDILGEISAWLNDLFKVAIEKGSDLTSVQQHLIFIEEHMLEIMHNNCRSAYSESVSDGGDPESAITDSTGATRYLNTLDMVIPLFWRDLLLTATIQNDEGVLQRFHMHREGADTKQEVRKQICGYYNMPTTLTSLLHYTHDPTCPEQLSGPDGQSFDDNWHTPAMKAAVPRLRAFLDKCDANCTDA